MINEVKSFLNKFGFMYEGKPRRLNNNIKMSRITHMKEELLEYETATNAEQDLDALVDLIYLAIGTAILHGFDIEEAFKRVHQANMKRIRKDKNNFKLGMEKPKDWIEPYLKDLVE